MTGGSRNTWSRLVTASAALAITCASTIVGAASGAGTEIGDATPATQNCTGDYTVVQTANVGPSFTVPTDGVITSVRLGSGATGDDALRSFKLVRPNSDDTYTVVAATDPTTVPSNQVVTLDVRLPARAGDLLGVGFASNGSSSGCFTAGGGSAVAYVIKPSVDEPEGATFAGTGGTGFRISVAATLEPDADGDGYGDLTQDGCPTNASAQGSCPVSSPPTQLTLGPLGSPNGNAKVGKRLSAPPVTVPSGATETFQWFRIAKKPKHHRTVTKPIGGATGAAYKAKKKDRGTKVFVRITLSAPGFTSASADSAPRKVK